LSLKGKKILLTGGSGTLGRALTKKLLDLDVDTIRIFSRDEGKQVTMATEMTDHRLRFIIGDVRDRDRVIFAMEDIDVVFHVAALKQVPVAEYNPFEAIKTNVIGSQNVIEACMAREVEFAVAISSDKAVSPLNTYGATKLLMEKIFTAANYYKGTRKTIFTCVRYGNVMGSRGSVIPQFINSIKNSSSITITDPNMTRFNITLSQALDLILNSMSKAIGGEIFVPKLDAYRLGDLARAIINIFNKNTVVNYTSIRQGEKMHESLINESESQFTIESDGTYIILSPVRFLENIAKYPNAKKECIQGKYSSENVKLIDESLLKKMIESEVLDMNNPFRPDFV
jgi:UDP-N-acetylglucosamine 4,6-dehydratase/5-epimerase